ncbi:DUF6286 domain-containing protein [Streptomyces sp. NPDC002306]
MRPDLDLPTRRLARHVTMPPSEEDPPPSTESRAGNHGKGYRARRPWSARRLPSALVATLILLGAAVALFDVVAVRAGRNTAAWRRNLTAELATRPMNDIWMLTGAAVAALAGVWLIVLALTPGLRRWLPLRSPVPRLRAFLDRNGAASLLRDAAMRVPGVSRAHITVHRHHVSARADVRFGDPRQVREDLTAALDDESQRLALASPPRIAVALRRRN